MSDRVSARKLCDISELLAAAREGDAALVAALIKGRADVNARGPAGQLPLHEAADGGHAGVVKVLLEGGADVDARCSRAEGAAGAAGVGGACSALVRVVMVGWKPGETPNKKSMQLATDTVEEMMHQACKEHALNYDQSTKTPAKVYVMPFTSRHSAHMFQMHVKFLKTVFHWHEANVQAHASGEAQRRTGGRTFQVLGIDVLVVNRKNIAAMKFYGQVESMANIIPHHDESIVKTKEQSPVIWASMPVMPFHRMFDKNFKNKIVHVKV